MTKEQYIKELPKWYENRRHIVFIGAGASIAALPDGDYYGNRTSCMNNIINDLNLQLFLAGIKLNSQSSNIEDIYSELCDREDCKEVREKIESAIYDYYSRIRIPNKLTIYDLLVLSLRNKDIIVSFNWDSLLLQAHMRWQQHVKDLPHLLFLHGNVGMGLCDKCRIPFPIGQFHYGDNHFYLNDCPKCHGELRPLKLLYPVKHKDYNKEPFIKSQWEYLKNILNEGAITTIFGYKAPNSDVEAMQIIKDAFVKFGTDSRQYDDIEIIERPGFSYNDLSESWWQLSDNTSHTPQLCHSFFESKLAIYPRRTIEAAKIYNIEGLFARPICQFKEEDLSFNPDELMKKMAELLGREKMNDYSLEAHM